MNKYNLIKVGSTNDIPFEKWCLTSDPLTTVTITSFGYSHNIPTPPSDFSEFVQKRSDWIEKLNSTSPSKVNVNFEIIDDSGFFKTTEYSLYSSDNLWHFSPNIDEEDHQVFSSFQDFQESIKSHRLSQNIKSDFSIVPWLYIITYDPSEPEIIIDTRINNPMDASPTFEKITGLVHSDVDSLEELHFYPTSFGDYLSLQKYCPLFRLISLQAKYKEPSPKKSL